MKMKIKRNLARFLERRDQLNTLIADELNLMFKPGDEVAWDQGVKNNPYDTREYSGIVTSVLVHNCAPYLIVSNKRRKHPFKVGYMPGNTRIVSRGNNG